MKRANTSRDVLCEITSSSTNYSTAAKSYRYYNDLSSTSDPATPSSSSSSIPFCEDENRNFGNRRSNEYSTTEAHSSTEAPPFSQPKGSSTSSSNSKIPKQHTGIGSYVQHLEKIAQADINIKEKRTNEFVLAFRDNVMENLNKSSFVFVKSKKNANGDSSNSLLHRLVVTLAIDFFYV